METLHSFIKNVTNLQQGETYKHMDPIEVEINLTYYNICL